MNQLACRACRRPLLGKDGCAVCSPWRKNLVVVGEAEEERPSLANVSAEAVRSLREQVRHYEAALKAAKTVDDQESYRALQRSVAGSLGKLLDAARKIQTDGLAAIERMSFAERAKLFVEWFMSLPTIYRERVKAEMEKHEGALSTEILQ